MNKFILLLILIFSSCAMEKTKNDVVYYDNYVCDIHEIDNSQYFFGEKIEYRIKPITYNNAKIDVLKIESILNNEIYFGAADMNFKVDTVTNVQLQDTAIYYTDHLEDNYNAGYITLLIFPDDLILNEETIGTIQGAANGIPRLTNVTLGKPVIFLRESPSQTAILAHEFGHAFGLLHTFQGDDLTNKGLNCGSGDKVPDTITPLSTGGIGNSDCTYYAPIGWDEYYTEDEILNLVQNPMSYSPHNCMKGFTQGQIERIRKIAEINPRIQDAEIKS